jgi:hypothetical protein
LERKAYGLSPKVLDIVMPTGLFGHVEYNVEIKVNFIRIIYYVLKINYFRPFPTIQ